MEKHHSNQEGPTKVVNLSLYEKVQECKQHAVSKSRTARELNLARGTVRKFWNMSREEYLRYEAALRWRNRHFDAHRQEIIELLETNEADKQRIYIASIYDVLEERHGSLIGTERTLGNYVKMLRETGAVSQQSKGKRVRRPLEELPYGRQCQVDFGQYRLGSGAVAYIYVATLSASRARYVAVQDHAFRTLEVIRHTVDAFRHFGGRPGELAIDQDRLMTVSENAGEIVHTEIFQQFIREQELGIWLCKPGDPESKGKVENAVKFVKSSFFSARKWLETVEEIHRPLCKWLGRRANGKVCAATGRVPKTALELDERPVLRALRASIFTSDALERGEQRAVDEKGMISYRANHYSVPGEYARASVTVLESALHLYIHDRHSGERIASHRIPAKKGQNIVAPHHRVPQGQKVEAVYEALGGRVETQQWARFLEGNRRDYRRYWKEQAASLTRLIDMATNRELLEQAVSFCVESESFGAGDLKHAYRHLQEAGEQSLPSLLEHARPILASRSSGGEHVSKRRVGYYSSLLSLVAGVLA